jgi:hypothetical protein
MKWAMRWGTLLAAITTCVLVVPETAWATDCNVNGVADAFDVGTLIAGTSAYPDTSTAKVYRYAGGTSWVDISPPSWTAASVMDMAWYAPAGSAPLLYAGTQERFGAVLDLLPGEPGRLGEIWVYDTALGTWTRCSNISSGSEAFDASVTVLEVVDGSLYAATVSTAWDGENVGGQVYKLHDGSRTQWDLVVTGHAIDHVDTNGWTGSRAGTVTTICGTPQLYLGELNSDQIFRYTPGGSPEIVSNVQPGSCIWDIQEFQGVLYAGAYQGKLFYSTSCTGNMQFASVAHNFYTSQNWALEVYDNRLYVGYAGVREGQGGGGLYSSPDGVNYTDAGLFWEAATAPDAYEGVSALATYDGSLFVGLGVPNGYFNNHPAQDGRAEVWRVWRTADGVHHRELASPTDYFGGAVQCLLTIPATSADANGNGIPDDAEVTISQQPVDVVVCEGAMASFSVVASGQGLTYQWIKDGTTTLSDGGDYAGTTTATLTVSPAAAADVGSYTCMVTSGCGSATSAAAVLSVLEPLSVTQWPTDQTIAAGEAATFSVTASGSNLQYAWYCLNPFQEEPLEDGEGISGAHTNQLTIAPGHDGAEYYVEVSSDCGSLSAPSIATLRVEVQAVAWRSLKTHSGTGELAITLNAAATATGSTYGGIKSESRNAPTQNGLTKIQVDFSAPVSVLDASAVTVIGAVTTGCDESGANCVQGTTTNFTPSSVTMTSAQTMTIAFDSGSAAGDSCYVITIGAGAVDATITSDNDCKVRMLQSDSTGDGYVTLSDVAQIKSRIDEDVTALNCASDQNLAAGIKLTDSAQAKSRLGRRALCP